MDGTASMDKVRLISTQYSHRVPPPTTDNYRYHIWTQRKKMPSEGTLIVPSRCLLLCLYFGCLGLIGGQCIEPITSEGATRNREKTRRKQREERRRRKRAGQKGAWWGVVMPSLPFNNKYFPPIFLSSCVWLTLPAALWLPPSSSPSLSFIILSFRLKWASNQ